MIAAAPISLTEITVNRARSIEDDPLKSALLEEGGPMELFTEFFASTFSHNTHHDWRAQFALRSLTPLLYEVPVRWEARLSEQARGAETVDAIDGINTDRLTLLARKYAAGPDFSDENTARLLILTERLRRLLPAATPQDLESLEKAIQEITQIAASDSEIRNLLLPPKK